MGVLENKRAVITGASRGFGLAVARAYLDEGARVVLAGRSPASLQDALARLSAPPGRALSCTCDVSQAEQVQALAEYACQEMGGFDIWVNNAALSAPFGPTLAVDPQEFNRVLQANIFGAYNGSRRALLHFLPHREGKLINILGRGDRGSQPMQNAYASSKSWLVSFTQALAAEYKGSGVGIYAFNPGMMCTELLTQVEVVSGFEARLSGFENVVSMWAEPPEVPAQRMVWLASAATDGRSELVVHQMTRRSMLSGAVRFLANRLLGKQTSPISISLTSVPPAFVVEENH